MFSFSQCITFIYFFYHAVSYKPGVSNLFYTADRLRFGKNLFPKGGGGGGGLVVFVDGVFKTGLFIYIVISTLK